MSLEAVLADPQLRARGLTRSQDESLVDAGELEGERVELLEGVLVEVVPQGAEHEVVVEALDRPSPTSRSPRGGVAARR